MITRHYIDVDGTNGKRRMHYRRCGQGAPLLMVHQSPRSSKEYEALMLAWGAHFTCIAPDTPGFGQSDALPGAPEIDDFADALVAFMDALGIAACPAYGFHSGGIILVTALTRHPKRFSALAIGGYAIWTPEEMSIFGERYLPPFVPQPYGEHLIWLWNRVLEQSWFFPWFDVRDDARLTVAHDDPARVHAVVMEMLDAGDAYRAGYGAVLRAPRDIPPPDALTPPVLITAYDGDPLQAHIDRLGDMPKGWAARKVATAAEHQAASLAFLLEHKVAVIDVLPEADDAGFIPIKTDGFDGLIHWAGDQIDPPGHGLSDDWAGAAPEHWRPWGDVLDAVAEARGRPVVITRIPAGDPDRLYPDLSPDRFGAYLTRAWSIARARALFEPWYEANAAHAIPVDPARLTSEALAHDHRNIIRGCAARAYHLARQSRTKGDDHGN
jgi:pimeloyl-ACP methyl ester carboxylesterase